MIRGIKEDLSDLHADLGTTGLGAFENGVVLLPQPPGEPAHLGRLAAPVHPFKCNEYAPIRHVPGLLSQNQDTNSARITKRFGAGPT
jgi:hypothetical protein